jgi:hypothetical protein
MKQVHNGDHWGSWHLEVNDPESPVLSLRVNGRERYYIDLHGIHGSAEMLDWIFQLRMKTWVTNDIIGDLISAFQGIFRPQQTLCGAGVDKKLDAKSFLKKRITVSAATEEPIDGQTGNTKLVRYR